MDTTAQTDRDIVNQLNNLIEVDYDAIEAYDAAIQRLADPRLKDQLRLFMGDHQRHTENLSGLGRRLRALKKFLKWSWSFNTSSTPRLLCPESRLPLPAR
jgi:predicted metal-dependent hydrolase